MTSVGNSKKLSSTEHLEIFYFSFHFFHKAIENLTFSAKQLLFPAQRPSSRATGLAGVPRNSKNPGDQTQGLASLKENRVACL